jgi:hypothetical protein
LQIDGPSRGRDRLDFGCGCPPNGQRRPTDASGNAVLEDMRRHKREVDVRFELCNLADENVGALEHISRGRGIL